MRPTWMIMDCLRKQTYQCAQHKLIIILKYDSRTTRERIKKIIFGGFSCCCSREDLSIDVSITTVELKLLTKLGWFLLSEVRINCETDDRQDFRIVIWKHTKKLCQSSKWSKLSIAICIPGRRGCTNTFYATQPFW